MFSITAAGLAAAEANGNDTGNLVVGLVVGAIIVLCAAGWFLRRYLVARRPAASREEHERLREMNGVRPEQKVVNDQTTVRPVRRGGI
ncbi:hypothetical protein ACTXI0_14745, partial [Arthrobacter rhombi]|uniref:hypothetical protein n=1 Tax=Micrococcaceae TaxID=1268 RepID=UPI000BB84BFA|nr:hypothetical protein [Glutamicibacter sp. BW78]PCC24816.1 hypothetical protein CIK75_11665 [Glutamicibacter sp. BW78]